MSNIYLCRKSSLGHPVNLLQILFLRKTYACWNHSETFSRLMAFKRRVKATDSCATLGKEKVPNYEGPRLKKHEYRASRLYESRREELIGFMYPT